jgi:hypothetical protein
MKMVKKGTPGYHESKVFRGGMVKDEEDKTPYTLSIIGASSEDENVVYETTGAVGKEAMDALVKLKVSYYVEDGWKVKWTEGSFTEISKGKQRRQLIVNEGSIKDLEDAEKAEDREWGGEEVSVELHIEFHVPKEQFDSEDVSAAINAVLDEGVHDLGDLGLEIETHILAGSYLEPVSKPGADSEKEGEPELSQYWTGTVIEMLPFGREKSVEVDNNLKGEEAAADFVSSAIEAQEKEGFKCAEEATDKGFSALCKLGKRKISISAYQRF